MSIQAFAAAGSDPEIRVHARQSFGDMVMEVAESAAAVNGHGAQPGRRAELVEQDLNRFAGI